MIQYSLLSGLTAFVFINLLCYPGEVFGWWPKLLRWAIFGKVQHGFLWVVPQADFDNMSYWELAIYKPLAGCAKCCAGWVSVAVYLMCFDFKLLPFVFFVVGAIFIAWLLTALKEKYSLDT